jgi:apolipoprotein N-acyltransferase
VTGAILGATTAALLLLGAERGDARLAWLVCAPLVAAMDDERISSRRAILIGTLFALLFGMLRHFGWLSAAAEGYFDLSSLGARTAAFVLCVGCALPLGALLGLLLQCATRLARAVKVGACGVAWTAWESLVRITFPSYPWIGLAATQVDQPSVLQLASVGGQAGLSLVLALAGCALGSTVRPVLAAGTGRERLRHIAPELIVVAALVAATASWGAWRLRAAPPAGPPLCAIAGVDPAIERPGALRDMLARYDEASAPAVALRPDALVWPESALPSDPFLSPDLLLDLRTRSSSWGTVLLVGGPRFEWGEDFRPRLFNSIFRIAPSGPLDVYDKREPVPFAETWPAGLPRPGWLEREEIASGRARKPMTVGGCRVGLLLCFEVERPGLARDLARDGADVIVVASNDAVLPEPAIATEVAEARLRAVETGLPVLRAANAGPSLAIDRYGRASADPGDGVVLIHGTAARIAPAVRFAGPLLTGCWFVVAAVVFTAWRRRGPRGAAPGCTRCRSCPCRCER